MEAGMRTKSFVDRSRVLLPVVYCGGLLWYFVDFGGSVQEAAASGLGPMVLGLGAIGLLFSVPLIIKAVRLLAKLPAFRSGPERDDDGGFDADAAIARYKAQKMEDPAPSNPPIAPRRPQGGPAPRASFGRRNK
jgi:hypothetical protein